MTPTMESVAQIDARVIAIVASELKRDPESLTTDATLQDAGIGSLDLIEILFALEDQLGITFEANHQDFNLTTLQDLLDEVRRLLPHASGGARE